MARNYWEDPEAARYADLLSQRVYTSQLIGRDPDLVLHGGGNTSVKAVTQNILGESEDVLYIKGSGWDLATIQAKGFSAVRLKPLLKLRHLSELSDADMVNYLRTHMTDFTMPTPSVEALLHAFIPETFVDHTHADAVLTLTNQLDGEDIVRRVYENQVAVVPYIMPGFKLAKVCAEIYEAHPSILGLILMKHGIFSFGPSAKESYERMIKLVSRAEEYINRSPRKRVAQQQHLSLKPSVVMSKVYQCLAQDGFYSVLRLTQSEEVNQFLSAPDAEHYSHIGPVTPDHVIRTKQFPLFVLASPEEDFSSVFQQALESYKSAYQTYFEKQAARAGSSLTMLDPYPRVILIPNLGMIAVGKTKKEAEIVSDIYRHTMKVILDAQAIGQYLALNDPDLFDVEYWTLEQAKLKKPQATSPFEGKTVVVTGGSSGIGAAICKQYVSHQALVFNLDIQASSDKDAYFIHTDVRDVQVVEKAFEKVIQESGKIDVVIVNAGLFPESEPVQDISVEAWTRSASVNLDGAFHTAKYALRWMQLNPRGGDMIFVASKNVPAPGKSAAAYSVMKAAQTQLARVCALEGGACGIRVNVVHPHMVFDTGIWTDDVIAQRAVAYGMTRDQYLKNNVLRTELTSSDVAKAVLALTDGSFSKTTGAQIPIDGGNDRVI